MKLIETYLILNNIFLLLSCEIGWQINIGFLIAF